MSDVITMSVDTSRFTKIFQDLGDVVEQDGVDFVRDETARLAEECAKQLSLRTSRRKAD